MIKTSSNLFNPLSVRINSKLRTLFFSNNTCVYTPNLSVSTINSFSFNSVIKDLE